MKIQELYNPKRDKESRNIGAANVGESIDFLLRFFLLPIAVEFSICLICRGFFWPFYLAFFADRFPCGIQECPEKFTR